MGWGSLKKLANPRNIVSVAAAPFTGGASLALLKNSDGKSIIGDITGANSAYKANQKNIALQNYWNNKNIELANTAHQRELADLKAAGINPVITGMGGSGAATPALESATVQNELPGGYLGQAQQAAGILQGLAATTNLAKNSALQQAQTAQTNAETASTQLNTAIRAELKPTEVQQAKQNLANAIEMQHKIITDTNHSAAQTEYVKKQTKAIKRGGKGGVHAGPLGFFGIEGEIE